MSAEQAKKDLARYCQGLMDNNVNLMVAIEQRYDLYGYPPSIVTVGIEAVAEGKDKGLELDKALGLVT